jgi:DNA-binding response OmpR family regulator
MADSQSRNGLENINVLVVDDNRQVCKLVSEILKTLGVVNVCAQTDAAKAYDELKLFSADIIIVDLNMEPLNGFDFARLVRTGKDTPNPSVPIIMLTGNSEFRNVTEARDAGINEYLVKPISPKSLYQRIASIIDNPRPFVQTQIYSGPDRRRRGLGPPTDVEERRQNKGRNSGISD